MIIDYILRRHGHGRLWPDPASTSYDDYVHWMHYAEGSAMPALIVRGTVARLGDAGASLTPGFDAEVANHLGDLNKALEGRPYILGDDLSAADIQLSLSAKSRPPGSASRRIRTSRPGSGAFRPGHLIEQRYAEVVRTASPSEPHRETCL
jgi:glutathione S-transferase